jgi:hypothetical protein
MSLHSLFPQFWRRLEGLWAKVCIECNSDYVTSKVSGAEFKHCHIVGVDLHQTATLVALQYFAS